jgi:hypothetical protein
MFLCVISSCQSDPINKEKFSKKYNLDYCCLFLSICKAILLFVVSFFLLHSVNVVVHLCLFTHFRRRRLR